MKSTVRLSLALLALLAGACTSGGGSPSCNTNDGLPLAGDAAVTPAPGTSPTPGTLPDAAPWPKFRHDNANTGNANTGRAADDPHVITLSENTGQILWQFPPANESGKGPFATSPAVINVCANSGTPCTGNPDCSDSAPCTARVFIGAADGSFYALDGGTGSLVFSYSTAASAITNSPAVDTSGRAFFNTTLNQLLRLTPTGFLDRAAAVGGYSASSPALATDGTAMVGAFISAQSGISGAVCTNGIARWSLGEGSVQAAPALGPDGITGTQVANCTVSSDTAPHGLVYVAESRPHPAVRAIDRCLGHIRWTFIASDPVVAAPLLELQPTATDPRAGTVYIFDGGGHLFAIDAESGAAAFGDSFSLPFTKPGPLPNVSSPALGANGVLYLGSTDGNLYAFDPTTGATRSFQTGGPIQSSIAVAGNAIVFGSNDGNVYQVTDDGTELTEVWHVAITVPGTEGPVPIALGRSSPAIGLDGTVYIGAADGRVYAIGTP
ncbi:MAG: PQQ-binding-like beta-propeller repeat protein [Deltaproteobacteria bacterium]|nr:PQQ-binding-like beta-propeller repeat protein [Deltaproteobacteria bacterium]MBI3390038.1 PQQ-binding-like beta-propeller repeat protein [Deltaproteobacteria bacterium]